MCRWNVPTDDLRDTSFLRETFQPRYPRDDPRHVVAEAASNESKKNFITGQLKNYTKVNNSIHFNLHSFESFRVFELTYPHFYAFL